MFYSLILITIIFSEFIIRPLYKRARIFFYVPFTKKVHGPFVQNFNCFNHLCPFLCLTWFVACKAVGVSVLFFRHCSDSTPLVTPIEIVIAGSNNIQLNANMILACAVCGHLLYYMILVEKTWRSEPCCRYNKTDRPKIRVSDPHFFCGSGSGQKSSCGSGSGGYPQSGPRVPEAEV